jgi:pimeloyl-ACP methyl ester carboxylesterase
MSGRQWRRLAEQLAPTHRVVLPDLLGAGGNPAWTEANTFDVTQDVAAMRELLDSLGEPVHLVGHSYGGFLALALARERLEGVRSVAVFDPTAYGVLHGARDAEGLADLERACAQPVFLDDARGGGAEWFEAFVDYWNGPGTWRGLTPAAQASFLALGRKVYLEARSLLAERTPPAAYARVRTPTLLLGGERSPVAARRVIALLAAALPHARAQLLTGAGHMGPITHAAEVNALVAAHLAAVQRPCP